MIKRIERIFLWQKKLSSRKPLRIRSILVPKQFVKFVKFVVKNNPFNPCSKTIRQIDFVEPLTYSQKSKPPRRGNIGLIFMSSVSRVR